MDFSQVKLPPIMDMNADTITENTIAMNSGNPDLRSKYVLERLVHHLHDFARETRLSTAEWSQGIQFLTAVGQICTDVRQEFILLSDVLGLSLLVDAIDHPKPAASTEGTVLGPFHTHEAELVTPGTQISKDENGEPLLVICTVKDTNGRPIDDVMVDIWETDSGGFYDVQHADKDGPDGRCAMRSGEDGVFWFKAIKPVSYPIPHDGPVGKFLMGVHRHPYRPAHMHFMFDKPGFDKLTTAVYDRIDPYITSDAVFGVKDSLVVDFLPLDAATAAQHLTEEEQKNLSAWSLLKYDFVLVSEKEAAGLRDANSLAALEALGKRMKVYNGLPVPDVD
ncbi:Intradiol ring-cleavage dioxygenase [Podospora appendiculata]|uniref:Intradiol ring-cleavage dioxygenase n=1 Tax=Podospora appendiculata TaxID=314037 RepID=A0AAE1C7B3_9PEZI|nr:Intradiol ring-cleavage dioxygenase [Podospora appendiculata]